MEAKENEKLFLSLPQDVLFKEILSRVPAKSIGQLSCVSKSWRSSLLHNPQLIRAQLHRQRKRKQKLILLSSSPLDHPYFITLTFNNDNNSATLNKSNTFPVLTSLFSSADKYWIKIVGSCDGLVLVVFEPKRWLFDDNKEENHHKITLRGLFDDEGGPDIGNDTGSAGTNNTRATNRMFVINVTTWEVVELPNNPLELDPYDNLDGFTLHGFGYDCLNDDYKVVTLTSYPSSGGFCSSSCDVDDSDILVDVFSLKTSTWKRKRSCFCDLYVPCIGNGVFLNSTLHWLALRRYEGYGPSVVIVAFNLTSEKFAQVPYPDPNAVGENSLDLNKLFSVGGCLGLVVSCHVCQIDVWIMEKYGVEESWLPFRIIGNGLSSCIPVCVVGPVEVILQKDGKKFIVYNLADETWKYLVIDGSSDGDLEEFQCGSVTAFLESLVSPTSLIW
ncbi:hypothetical protein ACH5RR_001975 [Cinchona calisaya]|uniref:F-box domain-containing protein n=1 Tax=Cinchona calisaya TaxID=153742 RepID=A0ABD3B6A4_9GENT